MLKGILDVRTIKRISVNMALGKSYCDFICVLGVLISASSYRGYALYLETCTHTWSPQIFALGSQKYNWLYESLWQKTYVGIMYRHFEHKCNELMCDCQKDQDICLSVFLGLRV